MNMHQQNPPPRPPHRRVWPVLLISVAALIGAGILVAKVGLGGQLGEAKVRAQAIECRNHLKQIVLAARIYANDHEDRLPRSLGDMQVELGDPGILACPLDPANPLHETTGWDQVDFAKSTYELLQPGALYEEGATTSIVKCRLHGLN
jgi:hypothetical protein